MSVNRLASIMWYCVGRFEMVIGLFSLGLATAMLALSRKSSSNHRESNPSLGLMAALLASAWNLFSGRKRVSRKSVRKRDPLDPNKLRP